MVNGVEVFSDRSCGANEKDFTIRGHKSGKPTSTNAAAQTAFQRQKKYLEAIAEEKAFKNKEKGAEAEKQKAYDKNCEIARGNLKTYETSGVIYEKRKDGKRHYLSDEERAEGSQQAKTQVSQWCKKL